MPPDSNLKERLGTLPWTAEIYWRIRNRGGPIDPNFNLTWLANQLPDWVSQVKAAGKAEGGKRLALFATLPYWITHSCLLGLALVGRGHQVSLGILPYGHYKKPGNRFDLRRQNTYALHIMRPARPLVQIRSLLDQEPSRHRLSTSLLEEIAEISGRDYRYSRGVETVDRDSRFYRHRLARNTAAARAAAAWLSAEKSDGVVLPNGYLFEFAAVYAAASQLGLPIRTYEFDQRSDRIWLAEDQSIHRLVTNPAWCANQNLELTETQREFLAEFINRQKGGPAGPGDGESLRVQLGLDNRPVVLLMAEGIGEIQTLGADLFSANMSAWLIRTAHYFASRPDVQFIVRTPPADLIAASPSCEEVLKAALPTQPGNFSLLSPEVAPRALDLYPLADLGLVYSSPAGLEMALCSRPVITAGQSHYRGKGFTFDPEDWDSYFIQIDKILNDPAGYRPSGEVVDLAWHYAHTFISTFSEPFPWHLGAMEEGLAQWPLSRVLSPEGQAAFGQAFQTLAGELNFQESG